MADRLILGLFCIVLSFSKKLTVKKLVYGTFVTFKGPLKAAVSNTRPAGRMWPARCICAARNIIKITQIIAETTVFCSIKALLASYCGPRRHFSFLMRPASPFFVKMWPAYETEFETPDLDGSKKQENNVAWTYVGRQIDLDFNSRGG